MPETRPIFKFQEILQNFALAADETGGPDRSAVGASFPQGGALYVRGDSIVVRADKKKKREMFPPFQLPGRGISPLSERANSHFHAGHLILHQNDTTQRLRRCGAVVSSMRHHRKRGLVWSLFRSRGGGAAGEVPNTFAVVNSFIQG